MRPTVAEWANTDAGDTPPRGFPAVPDHRAERETPPSGHAVVPDPYDDAPAYFDDVSGYLAPPTAVDYVRAGIGVVARLVMWACVWFIVGNAALHAVKEGG